MQLKDLVKPISEMTDEELLARVREIRHRREVERPVAKNKAAKAEKKESRSRVTKTETLLSNLSQEEIQALIAKLSG